MKLKKINMTAEYARFSSRESVGSRTYSVISIMVPITVEIAPTIFIVGE